MKIDPKDFCVPEGDSVKLGEWPTIVKPVYGSKKRYQEILEEHVALLSGSASICIQSICDPFDLPGDGRSRNRWGPITGSRGHGDFFSTLLHLEDCGVSPLERLLAMLAACNIIQEFRDPLRHTVGSDAKGAVQMHIALGHAAGRVAEQTGDGQLGKAEVARYAGKGVTENMWRHVTKFRLRADPVEHPNDPNEMSVALISREDILRTFPSSSTRCSGARP